MLANFATIIITSFIIGTSTARMTTAHASHKRQAVNTPATCTFVLQPTTFVNPRTSADLTAEFQFVVGFALSEAASENIFPTDVTVALYVGGTVKVNGTFPSEEAIDALVGKWVGQRREGVSATSTVRFLHVK